ncbi:hypothetical protein H0A36_06940 [Endozoicomonas sp. SM1973]|uniref:Transcriptional regulator SutA RNAP-binding domain-containing protein n=1 Tax=Spartinivicinus marinus TaxID=2994442 RepID=A0A853I6J5_9GAMM|nr:hypothetical protein [Spartinivicinus marinus]MCX4025751.1 hypothetical protein [Spartinivicinus marinus]NYZ65744.1 hypothetical protein [Spartinivicinus marinus]
MFIRKAVTHQSIEEQTVAFLKSGGEIVKIPSGISGKKSVADRKREKEENA